MHHFKKMTLCAASAALLTLLFWSGCSPKPPEHGILLLVEVGTNQIECVSMANTVAATQDALSKRLAVLPRKPTLQATGSCMIQIILPTTNTADVSLVRQMILKTGMLEFRMVHVDSERLLREDVVPTGYEIKKETRTLPNGEKQLVPFLVNKIMLPGLTSQQFKNVNASRGVMGTPQIAFNFEK